jgi:hypothetical protein
LIKNGFEKVDNDLISYTKPGMSTVEICLDEIVFIDDTGDWLHIPLNIYALIGALFENRMIAANYRGLP